MKRDLEADDDNDIGGLFANKYCGDTIASDSNVDSSLSVDIVKRDLEANDDDDIGCLFASDATGTGPLVTLFVLLQDATLPTITASFLEDLFSQYNQVAAGEDDNDQLACIFWHMT